MRTRVSIGITQCVSTGPVVSPASKDSSPISGEGNSVSFVLNIEADMAFHQYDVRPSSTSLKKCVSIGNQAFLRSYGDAPSPPLQVCKKLQVINQCNTSPHAQSAYQKRKDNTFGNSRKIGIEKNKNLTFSVSISVKT